MSGKNPEVDRRHHERRESDRRLLRFAISVALSAMAVAIIAVVVTVFVTHTVLDSRDSVQLAVCAVADYGDAQVTSARDNLPKVPPSQRKRATDSIDALHALVVDMRSTGIKCPPPR